MARTKARGKNSFYKQPLWRAAVVVVVLMAVAAGLELAHVTDFWQKPVANVHSGPTEEEKQEQAKTDSEEKRDAIENPREPSTPNAESVGSTKITLTAQQTSDNVVISANLGAIADGSCTLTITNGEKTTSKTAEVIYQPQYSTCAGFSIPVSDLGTGTWQATLTVSSAGATVSKSISHEVQ